MRGKTLDDLIADFRVEIRASLNPGQNTQQRESQVMRLQKTQEWLHGQYNWPHLLIKRQYALAAGQRYYDFQADFDVERITSIAVRTDDMWQPLIPGVCNADYLVVDSDRDEREFPTRKWALAEDDQIELWPISDRNGNATTLDAYVQVTGIKKLSPLIEDGDRADLDSLLVVWYAAAEHLAAAGDKSAKLVLDKANARFARLRNQQTKVTGFPMFGVQRSGRPQGPVMHTYKPPVP